MKLPCGGVSAARPEARRRRSPSQLAVAARHEPQRSTGEEGRDAHPDEWRRARARRGQGARPALAAGAPAATAAGHGRGRGRRPGRGGGRTRRRRTGRRRRRRLGRRRDEQLRRRRRPRRRRCALRFVVGGLVVGVVGATVVVVAAGSVVVVGGTVVVVGASVVVVDATVVVVVGPTHGCVVNGPNSLSKLLLTASFTNTCQVWGFVESQSYILLKSLASTNVMVVDGHRGGGSVRIDRRPRPGDRCTMERHRRCAPKPFLARPTTRSSRARQRPRAFARISMMPFSASDRPRRSPPRPRGTPTRIVCPRHQHPVGCDAKWR